MGLDQVTRESQTKKEPAPTTAKKSLLEKVGAEKLFLTFVFACFLGTVVETIWCFITRGTIESRAGLIYGPFNLVYGFGAFLMLALLHRFEKNWAIFLGSALIGGVFEYVCSVFQEVSFGTVSWNYVENPALTLHGRTNYLYMFFWGALGLLFLKVLFPIFSQLLDTALGHFSRRSRRIFLSLLALFMVFNSLISFAAVWRQAERRDHVHVPPTDVVREFLDETYDDQRLQQIFPNMQLVTDDGITSLWNDSSYGG